MYKLVPLRVDFLAASIAGKLPLGKSENFSLFTWKTIILSRMFILPAPVVLHNLNERESANRVQLNMQKKHLKKTSY